jgi:HEAT repeat protein
VAKLADDPNNTMRDYVEAALRRLEPDAAQSTALLATALSSAFLYPRYQVVGTLHAPTVVPKLLEIARGPDEEKGAEAVWLLGSLGTRASAAGPDLVALVRGKRRETAAKAARAIGSCCRDAVSMDALVEGLEAADPEVRRACLWSLREVGPAAARGQDKILAFAERVMQDDGSDAADAIYAYVANGGDKRVAARLCVRRLRSFPERSICWQLERLGIADDEVLSALRDVRSGNDRFLRIAAQEAYEKLVKSRLD